MPAPQLLPPNKMQGSVISSLFSSAYFITANKDDKENSRIKLVLKENRFQKRIIGKIYKRMTSNHNLSQSQQQTQTTDF